MDELMIENAFFKIKIVEYEKQYIKKKGINQMTPEAIIKMRRAVSFRLKKEINKLSKKHEQITNRIYDDSSADVSFM